MERNSSTACCASSESLDEEAILSCDVGDVIAEIWQSPLSSSLDLYVWLGSIQVLQLMTMSYSISLAL